MFLWWLLPFSSRENSESCDSVAYAGFLGSDLSHKSVAGCSQRTQTFHAARVTTMMSHKKCPLDRGSSGLLPWFDPADNREC